MCFKRFLSQPNNRCTNGCLCNGLGDGLAFLLDWTRRFNIAAVCQFTAPQFQLHPRKCQYRSGWKLLGNRRSEAEPCPPHL